MPGRRRFPSNAVILFSFLAAFAVLRWGCDFFAPPSGRGESQTVLVEGECHLVRVVDGDTLVVSQHAADSTSSTNTHQFKIRLLGVDTPETVKPNHPVEPFGPEAAKFTRRFVAEGTLSVRLDRRRQDRYGRWLAYVYRDGEMLNLELLRQGLARVSIYPGDSATIGRKLRQAEESARQAKTGIWSIAP